MAENNGKKEQFRELRKDLKKVLSKSRYEHVIGVEYTAAALAMRYGENLDDARLAGLLHDCAKYLSDEELLSECKKNNLEVTEAEKKSPYLLHGKVGAFYCKKKYGITQENVLNAITWHTTGKEDMTLLEKIIFIADYIEPGRDKAKNLEEIRGISFQDIDEAVYRVSRDTLKYLEQDESQTFIDDKTKETYLFYKNIHDEKEEKYGQN